MQLRVVTADDHEAIRQLHLQAFDASEAAAVARLAVDLLNDDTALPRLALVAEGKEELTGCIIFSAVTLQGCADQGYILAPLAVAPQRQRSGIGTALIREGLRRLGEAQAGFVLVYGDPAYYSRTGFAAGHGIAAPFELTYPEGWLALELIPGTLANVTGTIQCAKSLSSPEHW